MRRHDRVFLVPGASFRPACAEIEAGVQAAVRKWIDAGRPLVAARQAPDRPGVVLGLTLPTAQGRQRVGVLVERQDIAATRSPLSVAQCLPRLPAAEAGPLALLEENLAGVGVEAGVYGSLAWEVMADAAYRYAESDIDLICDVRSLAQLGPTLAALRQCAARLGGKLDGEIRLPNGDAVAWKELDRQVDAPQASVLVKGERIVGLLTVQELLASLVEEHCHA